MQCTRSPIATAVRLCGRFFASLAIAGTVPEGGWHAVASDPQVLACQPEAKKLPRADQANDQLPKHAVARLGKSSLRHPGFINRVVFAPDGKTLASCGYSTLCLWDWATGREISRVPLAHVETVAFSHDSRLVGVVTDRERVYLWDIAKAREIRAFDVRRPSPSVFRSALAFSVNNNTLVYSGDDAIVQGWDINTRKERHFAKLAPQGDIISVLALTPDGEILAYATRYVEGTHDAGPIRLIDTTTGKELHRLRRHRQPVWSLAFAPDGKTLASASTTESPILWDVATGKAIRQLQGESGNTCCLAWSPDGKAVASGDAWYKLRIWQVATGQLRAGFHSELWPNHLAFAPDGKSLAVADHNVIREVDVVTGQERRPPDGPITTIDYAAWLPDGKTVALSTREAAWLWKGGGDQRLARIWATRKPFFDPRTLFALSPDGRTYGLARRYGIELYDLASHQSVRRLEGIDRWGTSFTYSRDGTMIAMPTGGGVVLWNAATGKVRREIRTRDGTDQVAIAPDGKMIASSYSAEGGDKSGVQLWDTASGKALQKLATGKASCRALAFSPRGGILAALTISLTTPQRPGEGGLIVWDLATRKERFRLPKIDATVMAISPDGELLACEGDESDIYLLDTQTGKTRHHLSGHRARISALAFSANGSSLVSGSVDATALVWDIVSLKDSGE